MKFYVGLYQSFGRHHVERACISVNRVQDRLRKPIAIPDVLLDSGAFTELAQYGGYRHGVRTYAAAIRRLVERKLLNISAAVAQDFMCEPFMLARTGLTTAEHQALTIARYRELLAEAPPCLILPVLQGYAPHEYVAHLAAYGTMLPHGAWVGVGSVCKRNTSPESVVHVLHEIKSRRPDLRLHGFGVKITALEHPGVRELLWSADSMAWSYHARKQGRDGNSPVEARRFVDRVESVAARAPAPWQLPLL